MNTNDDDTINDDADMDDAGEQVPSVLACDVGNTAIRIAHVKGNTVAGMKRFRVGELGELGVALADLWDSMPLPKHMVACSVNPSALKALEAAAGENIHAADGRGEPVLVIGRDLPLPMDVQVTSPSAVGVDRVCAATAAFDRLGVACVVADFGTAVTVDVVNPEGEFMGGAIMPGLGLSAAALHDRTAQLPLVELVEPHWTIGRDTKQAIVGGLVFGARGALRELVERYATELGHWPVVIATGSDAELVVGNVSENELVQAIVPDLVLRGIAAAYYRSLVE